MRYVMRQHIWACGHSRRYQSSGTRPVHHEGLCGSCASRLARLRRAYWNLYDSVVIGIRERRVR